jgi:hypothetical protein
VPAYRVFGSVILHRNTVVFEQLKHSSDQLGVNGEINLVDQTL